VNQENIYNKEETLIWKSSERDVMIGESGNMDPKSELGVKKALHPPKTLHFCGSQGISTPGLKRAKMLIFKPLVGRCEQFGLILAVPD
jgi:hypothetical protein